MLPKLIMCYTVKYSFTVTNDSIKSSFKHICTDFSQLNFFYLNENIFVNA